MFVYDNINDFVKDVYYKWYPGMNICFTGGEVLLQPIDDLERALDDIKDHTGGLCDIELFTNGSFKIPGNLRRMFNTVVLDWKLPGSGESYVGAQDEHVVYNIQRLGNTDAVKFTIASRNDFDVAFTRFKEMASWPMPRVPPIFVGVVWGKVSEADLVAWMLEAEVAWTLNVQLHKYVWDANARRT
jgi:7-carboxy-7-deazaguanine synthase